MFEVYPGVGSGFAEGRLGYAGPKKAGVAKKSQQARDREAIEAEAKETAKQQVEEKPSNGGLFANAKISADALKKLTETEE